MTGWHKAATIVVLAGMLAGCGSLREARSTDRGADPVVVLAKADGWRDGLAQATGDPYALIEIVDPTDSRQAWHDKVPADLPTATGDPADPGVYRPLAADVDLERYTLVVYSSGQSSSCPAWVDDLSFTEGRIEVILATTAGPGEPCTDDFQPYRLVLAVDPGVLPSRAELPVERIDVVSDNLIDVAGRAVAYPANRVTDE